MSLKVVVGKKRQQKRFGKYWKVDNTTFSEVIIDNKYRIKNDKQVNIELNEYNDGRKIIIDI